MSNIRQHLLLSERSLYANSEANGASIHHLQRKHIILYGLAPLF